MAIEKKFVEVPPQALTSNGSTYGRITVADATLFRVKQKVLIKSNTQPPRFLEVKRINSDTELELGDDEKPISQRVDLTSFLVSDSATIQANEQVRPSVPLKELQRAVYAEEPAVAIRALLIDKLGESYSLQNPLPVQLSDGSIEIGTVNAELEVQLSHQDDVPNPGDIADSVQIGDGNNILQIEPDGSINVNSSAIQELDIQNVAVANKNTEVSITIPNGTRRLEFQARNNSKIQWTFVSSESNTNFVTLNPGNIETINEVKLDSKTLYLQTSKDNEIIEVRVWTLA